MQVGLGEESRHQRVYELLSHSEVNSDRYQTGTTYDKRPNFDRKSSPSGICLRTGAKLRSHVALLCGCYKSLFFNKYIAHQGTEVSKVNRLIDITAEIVAISLWITDYSRQCNDW